MRKSFFLTLFAMMAMLVSAQNRIPGTNVQFSLPEGEWKYLQTTKVDKNTNVYLYSYLARNVVDSKGDTILPYVRIYVRKNYSPSAIELAAERWMQQPFQSLFEYTTGLPGDGGIGYIGAYNNSMDGKDYVFRMIYFKEKNTAIEFRVETTRDTYEQFDALFEAIVTSVK